MKWFLMVLVVMIFSCCLGQSKMNGISFVASPKEITSVAIDPVVAVKANWAAVIPFGFIRSLETPTVIFNSERQWWGEKEEGVKKTIQLFKDRGVNIMLKPQIWVSHGVFTGKIAMRTEEHWKELERTYEHFILLYACLAEEMEVPLLCIGTELETFIHHRPQFWDQLIKNVREVYKGKLTYAENWDTFEAVPFWKQLDYIGVNAYFPVSDHKTPTVNMLRNGWRDHKDKIAALQSSVDKSVVFTEYGYRSVHYTAKKPWDSDRISGNVNEQAQVNALTALYQEFWKEPWFSGGFLWKWHHDHQESGGKNNNRFTIQNKPAEDVIRSFYRTK